jgi:hypothetical protein
MAHRELAGGLAVQREGPFGVRAEPHVGQCQL